MHYGYNEIYNTYITLADLCVEREVWTNGDAIHPNDRNTATIKQQMIDAYSTRSQEHADQLAFDKLREFRDEINALLETVS